MGGFFKSENRCSVFRETFLLAPYGLSPSWTEVGGQDHVTHLLRQVPANRLTRPMRGTFLDKQQARAALKAARASLDPAERARLSGSACRALSKSPLLEGRQTVALYAAFGPEADPAALEEDLIRTGRRIVYPRMEGDRLVFHQLRLRDLAPGPWGIPEPPADATPVGRIDLFVVPGLGFTKTGERIGYGRGFYDRVLADRDRAPAVGFAFPCQLVDALPTEDHDERLDAVVAGDRVWMVSEP